MNTEAKQKLYDILFAIGQQIMNHHDPCAWKDGMCIKMRLVKEERGCCDECKHLAQRGCTVKPLACKLWLCDSQASIFRECETELKILRLVADNCGIPYEWRKSKEENFKLKK
jgi:hypothetical protein